MLFAEELPISRIDPGNAVIIVIVLLTVVFLASAGALVASLVILGRRKPTIEAEFSTKAESSAAMAALRAELHREITGVKDSICLSDERTEARFASLDESNEKRSESFMLKMDSILHSFDNGMRDVHRAIGRLEGPSKA